MKLSKMLGILLLTWHSWTFADELTFAIHPILPPGETVQFYQPLADYLSQKTGHEIKIVTAINFLTYWQSIRLKDYDLTLDGAHFTDYRIQKLGYQPLVKVPGEVSYSIVTHEHNLVLDMPELVGKTIAAPCSPNMGTLRLNELFPNPSRQPRFVEVDNSLDALEQVRNGRLNAAIIATPLLNDRQEGLHVITTTKSSPHVAISASPTLATEIQAAVKLALLEASESETGKALLAKMKISHFDKAKSQQYQGYAQLLQDQWGY